MVSEVSPGYETSGPGHGVGASIQGINGDPWGHVDWDDHENNCWRLSTGRIAKRASHGIKWVWVADIDPHRKVSESMVSGSHRWVGHSGGLTVVQLNRKGALEEVVEEKRLGPDGEAYTLEEFREYFGNAVDEAWICAQKEGEAAEWHEEEEHDWEGDAYDHYGDFKAASGKIGGGGGKKQVHKGVQAKSKGRPYQSAKRHHRKLETGTSDTDSIQNAFRDGVCAGVVHITGEAALLHIVSGTNFEHLETLKPEGHGVIFTLTVTLIFTSTFTCTNALTCTIALTLTPNGRTWK